MFITETFQGMFCMLQDNKHLWVPGEKTFCYHYDQVQVLGFEFMYEWDR